MDPRQLSEAELATLQGIFASTIQALETTQREVGRLEAERDAALAKVQELEERVRDLQSLVTDLAARVELPADSHKGT